MDFLQIASQILAPLAIPLVALLIGWAIGFFDSNRRAENKIKHAEESAAIAIRNAEDRLAQAATKNAEAPTIPYAVDDPGLMRIKNENGILTLDLDGERMLPNALTAEQRKRFIEILNAIRPWLEGKPAFAPEGMPVNPSPSSPKPVTEIRQPASTPSFSPSPQPSLAKPTASKGKSSTKDNKKKADEPEAAPTSIAGQINLILQDQIANTPLVQRGVSISESASGGVSVFVGLSRYEGVDEVPDEEVKAAIRTAIAAWEKKYTPGLPS